MATMLESGKVMLAVVPTHLQWEEAASQTYKSEPETPDVGKWIMSLQMEGRGRETMSATT